MEYYGLADRQDVSSDNASARDIRTSCADDIAEFLYATFS